MDSTIHFEILVLIDILVSYILRNHIVRDMAELQQK